MSQEKLALFGGTPAVAQPWRRYNSIGQEEKAAAIEVLERGVLSQFLGTWHPHFYGGPKVLAFEAAWQEYFAVPYAVSVNSATSGLMAALGAIGLEPGDEVIVSPWTMCATATSILVWNAIPVFVDIEERTFGLDPAAVARAVTPYTKAIVVTDVFGHPARLDEIMALARSRNLKVVEDAAQSPGSRYRGRWTGTVADVGVFSLNYHKHIQVGEGGVCVTSSAELAERMQLIRNHAEAVVSGKGVENLANMIGFNFRLTEISAAIGIEQLKKLPALVERRQAVVERLTVGLKLLPGLRTAVVEEGCTHVYFVYPLLFDSEVAGVSRAAAVEALRAEGVPITDRYENLHLLPMYQKRVAYGTRGFPWTAPFYQGSVSYEKGICPVAERLREVQYLDLTLCLYDLGDNDVDDIVRAWHKVWRYRDVLRERERHGEQERARAARA